MNSHLAPPRSRRRIAIFIALAAALTACKTPSGVTAQAYGSVTGRVYDAKTEQALGNVQVSIGPLILAHTSPDGSFLLTRVPVGEQAVTVNPPGGYAAPTPAPVEVRENRTTPMAAIAVSPVR